MNDLTLCPFCRSYHLRERQAFYSLRSANGDLKDRVQDLKVKFFRCGRCRREFAAADHFVERLMDLAS